MTDALIKTNLTEDDWNLILGRIQKQRCTPILGSAVYQTVLDFRLSLAQRWLDRYHRAWQAAEGEQVDAALPNEDSLELARVAQYLTVQVGDTQTLKEEFQKLLAQEVMAPNFADPDEPYHILAELPIPVYLTTNCDDYMSQALRQNPFRDPKTVVCRWNDDVAKTLDLDPTGSKFSFDKTFQPTVSNPMVFHCHGHTEVPESLVLTEDDHLSFLVTVSRDLDNTYDMANRDQMALPAPIQKVLNGGSLLFIGFRLTDWSFRVVFQGVLRSLLARPDSKLGLAVQLPIQDRYTQRYLQTYYDKMHMRVFWGTATEFMIELRNRWRALPQ